MLRFFHNNHLVVNLALTRLYNIIILRFYWKGLRQDVCDWVAVCKDYFTNKADQSLSHRKLIPIISEKTFELIFVDISKFQKIICKVNVGMHRSF